MSTFKYVLLLLTPALMIPLGTWVLMYAGFPHAALIFGIGCIWGILLCNVLHGD